MDYYNKYLKYKNKYLNEINGGALDERPSSAMDVRPSSAMDVRPSSAMDGRRSRVSISRPMPQKAETDERVT
jgi:hypothetical protein